MKIDWSKLLSGRLFLVVCGGVVFIYATYAKILNAEAVASIITMVYVSYFNRQDRNGTTDKGGVK